MPLKFVSLLFFLFFKLSLAQTSGTKIKGYSLITEKNITVDSIVASNKFKKEEKPFIDLGYFNQKAWFKFPIEISKDQNYILDYYQHFIDSLQLHIIKDNKLVHQSELTGLHQLKKRNYNYLGNNKGYAFPLNLKPGSYDAYFEIHSKFSPIRGQVTLWNKEAYQSRKFVPTQYKSFWYGVFGFVLFASFISLIFWGFTKELVFLIFSLYIIISVINIYITRGFTSEVFLWFPNSRYDIRAFFNAGLAFITTLYFYHLVPTKYANVWIRKIMFWQLIISSTTCLIVFLLPVNIQLWHWFIRLMKPIFFSNLIIGVFHFYFAFRNGHELSKIYLLAYATLFIAIIFHLLQVIGVFKVLDVNIFIWEISVFLELLIFIFAFVHRYHKIQKEKLQLVEKINLDQKTYLEKYYLAQENERKNIAKKLHDGIVQQLVTLGFGIQNLDSSKKKSLSKTLNNSIEELRNLSHQLIPKSLTSLGLLDAIEDLLQTSLEHTNITYEYEHYDIKKRPAENIELNLYRCIQEIIHNTIKHSKASKLELQLYQLEEELFLTVSDNGIGMQTTNTYGLGLKSIASRIESIQGLLKIDSSQEFGFNLTIKIPLNK